MLSSMRLTLNLVVKQNRHACILPGSLKSIVKFDPAKSYFYGAPVVHYHCSSVLHSQTQEVPVVENNASRTPPSRGRLGLLNKVQSSQVVYQPLSLATLITLSRAAMAPALGYFIWNGMHYEALACMVYVVASDYGDKRVAQRTKQASPVFYVLDLLADKLVILTSFLALYNMDIIPYWLVRGQVFREMLVNPMAALLRYYGFGKEKPSLSKFMSFNKYPTLGLRPLFCERVHRVSQYALIMSLLAISETQRTGTLSWPIFVFQVSHTFLTCLTITWRYFDVRGNANFMSRMRYE